MERAAFLAAMAAMPGAFMGKTSLGEAAVSGRTRRSAGDADPSVSAPVPALRVLLGHGSVRTLDENTFTYEGRVYRGSFSRLPDGGIVNTVPVEQYLYSVVSREMTPSWPRAALQAQAVCARTYVLQRSEPERAYDLVASESDQIYVGLQAETSPTAEAVNATAGRVLRFKGAFASIAYSSSCGGHTESSEDAWGGNPRPYLRGVACPWCTRSPDYHWANTIDGVAALRALPPQDVTTGPVRNLRVLETDASGRARHLELEVAEGTAFTIEAADFRRALGSRVIRSLLIRSITADAGGAFVVQGSGLGHGVGLCQWGANGMASAGRRAEEILAFYFPGTTLGND